jgi:hypothetical protein
METATTTYIILRELAGNPPPQLNAIQLLLAPHIDTITALWTAAWITMLAIMCRQVWHAYKAHKTAQQ